MFNKFDFREPLIIDDYGLYVTAGQMQFFLNQPQGEKKFETGHEDFRSYYNNCAIYNLVYDMTDIDPDCASIYWDEKTESVAVAFPVVGKVANKIKAIAQLKYEDANYDDYGFPLDF